MSDFLDHLVTRSLAPTADVQPRLLSFFEPPPGDHEFDPIPGAEPIGSPHGPEHKNRVAERRSALSPEVDARLRSLEALWAAHEGASAESTVAPRPTHSSVVTGWPPRINSLAEIQSAPDAVEMSASRHEPRVAKPDEHPTALSVARNRLVEPIASVPPEPPAVSPLVALDPRDARARNGELPATPAALPSSRPEIDPVASMVAGDRTRSRQPVQPFAPSVTAPTRHWSEGDARVFPERLFTTQSSKAKTPADLARRWPESSPAPPQVIQVTIGRVEVRAMPAAVSTPRSAPAAKPVMSLEEYLQRRSAGGGR